MTHNHGTRVLLLSELKPQTGNSSTAQRIRRHIEEASHTCMTYNTCDVTSVDHFKQLLNTFHPDVVIGIHAYHAGKWLIYCPLPYCLVFGGTDVNVLPANPDKLTIMRQAVDRARVLVAFSKSVLDKARACMLISDSKAVRLIPQAVKTRPLSTDESSNFLQSLGFSYKANHMLTIAGGIRPVKDSLYLLSAFSEWHTHGHEDVILVFAGPILDEMYAERFHKALKKCHGIYYIGGRTLQETHALIKSSLALVNCSISEGQAGAILEAMDLGTCVLARDIPANTALVRHNHTGLVFSTPQDFLTQLEYLIEDESLKETLISNAKDHVTLHHGYDSEGMAYIDLVNTLVKGQSKTVDIEDETINESVVIANNNDVS